jgi:hypothetical protein
VAGEGVRLDALAGILEWRFADGESRWLIDGDVRFAAPVDGVVRVGIGTRRELRGPLMEGLFADSSVALRMPDVDLDSETVHDLKLEFFTGANPLVLISGEGTMPRDSLEYLVDRAVEAMGEVDWRRARFVRIADKIDYIGLWVLNRRIRRVEASVREALADVRFSSADLAVLQAYPDRLAAIEQAAGALRARWPEVRSAQPESEGFPVGRLPIAPDPFGKYVDEAAQDAKDAIGRLSGLISSQQIVLTQRQAQETSRFQRVVTIVGASVLVPGLIAAIFGANVGFHGRGTTAAFWAMLLLMAGGAVATYALLRSFEAGAWRRLARSPPVAWIADRPLGARLAALGLIGGLLLALGVLVLVRG